MRETALYDRPKAEKPTPAIRADELKRPAPLQCSGQTERGTRGPQGPLRLTRIRPPALWSRLRVTGGVPVPGNCGAHGCVATREAPKFRPDKLEMVARPTGLEPVFPP